MVLGVLAFLGYGIDLPARIAAATINQVDCPVVFTQARSKLLSESARPAPQSPGIGFTPDATNPGRLMATITWIADRDAAQNVVAVAGLYGQRDIDDDFIDKSEPSAAPGYCWNWYASRPPTPRQPRTVRIELPGLWAKQRYCFWTANKDDGGGYTEPTKTRCIVTPWEADWGTPKKPPRNETSPADK